LAWLIEARQLNHCPEQEPLGSHPRGTSMVTDLTFKNAYASQRSIYDERYQVGHYDHRSAVRVLTAERDALSEAMDRALKSNRPVRRVNLFDFGYGTGRVTNEFIGSYVHNYGAAQKDLRVVAYDVSSAGLKIRGGPGLHLLDFGYGTGRVTNEFIGSYVHNYGAAKKDLRVVAYDVSPAGL